MNACGHHHVGHIGILGVDKKGEEWYQISLGGAQGNDSSLGKILGPSFDRESVPEVIDKVLQVYVGERAEERPSSKPIAESASSLSRSGYMPDQNAATRPFIRDGQPAEDRWVLIREDEAVLPDAPAIVPLARWQAREEGRVLAPWLASGTELTSELAAELAEAP